MKDERLSTYGRGALLAGLLLTGGSADAEEPEAARWGAQVEVVAGLMHTTEDGWLNPSIISELWLMRIHQDGADRSSSGLGVQYMTVPLPIALIEYKVELGTVGAYHLGLSAGVGGTLGSDSVHPTLTMTTDQCANLPRLRDTDQYTRWEVCLKPTVGVISEPAFNDYILAMLQMRFLRQIGDHTHLGLTWVKTGTNLPGHTDPMSSVNLTLLLR